MTSFSNVVSVTSVAIRFHSFPWVCSDLKRGSGACCSRSRIVKRAEDLRAASACPRSSRARAGDPRTLGGRGDVLQAARPEPRRPAVRVHGRPDHGEQPDGRPPRLGADDQGRLPALQGAARLRPPLPERVRLPGPPRRGRGREVARARLEARHRGVRARRVRRALQGARRALRRGDRRAVEAPRHVDGLGQLDYFTFSDTNIEYIWRFLAEVHRRGWLYKGHRSTQWCPRCGTSLSKHEQAGEENYVELEHPSLFVRFPLKERDGRVARRLDDDALDAAGERRRRRSARGGVRAPAERRVGRGRAPPGATSSSSACAATELVGLEYEGPFDFLPAQEGVVHRVIPWDEVALDEGTGIVHIAPGAGAEDFELSRVHDLPVLAPIDESGRMIAGYGELEGRTTEAVAEPVDRVAARARAARRRRHDRPPLSDLLALQDAARLPRRRRLVHLGRRDPAADARRERDRRVDAGLLLEADGRLAAEHGRLEHLAQALLRAAAARSTRAGAGT